MEMEGRDAVFCSSQPPLQSSPQNSKPSGGLRLSDNLASGSKRNSGGQVVGGGRLHQYRDNNDQSLNRIWSGNRSEVCWHLLTSFVYVVRLVRMGKVRYEWGCLLVGLQ